MVTSSLRLAVAFGGSQIRADSAEVSAETVSLLRWLPIPYRSIKSIIGLLTLPCSWRRPQTRNTSFTKTWPADFTRSGRHLCSSLKEMTTVGNNPLTCALSLVCRLTNSTSAVRSTDPTPKHDPHQTQSKI